MSDLFDNETSVKSDYSARDIETGEKYHYTTQGLKKL